MENIEIRLVTNNSNAVKGIKEVNTEVQKLSKSEEQYTQKRKGLIEKEIQMQKQLSDSKTKAANMENLRIYNKLLEASKDRLDKLNKAGIEGNKEVEKSADGVLNKVGKLAIAYLTVNTAIKVLKETALAFFTKSQEGIELLERKVAGLKAAWAVFAGEFVAGGKKIAGSLDDSEKKTRRFWTFLTTIFAPSWIDVGMRMDMATEAAEKYTASLQEIADAERAMIVPRALANAEIIKARLIYADTTKSSKERIAALEKALELEQKTAEEEVKHQQWVILNLRDINNEKKKTGQLRDEDLLAMEQAIAKEIELQSESSQRQIRAFRNLMEAKRELNDKANEEIKKAQDVFNKYWDKVDKEELERITKAAEDKWKFETEWGKKLFEQNKKLAEETWDAIIEADKKAEKEDEELRKKRLDSIKEGLNKLLDFTQQITDNLVEDAERNREILDTRISETQRALDTEVELYEAGYSSNVAAKQKELDNLKKLREQALKDEEQALQRQRQMEAISQGVNIFSSATNILKSFTKLGPIGLALAAGAIAAMFTLLGSVKAKSTEITKLAKGGHGEVTGRLHSQGGERFSDHIEVEQGERWGVLNRSASRKYGTVFNKMVDSFNKDNLPIPRDVNINNISIQNEGPNKRLDEVNSNLRQIRSKEEIIVLNGMTVYKKGNSVRIIKR